MNAKIKNYVEVLFNDIPQTRKAAELKEEILSNLNDHFQAHISEGKTETQAYTEAINDLGELDELFESLKPKTEIVERINEYKKKKAVNISAAVIMYIVGVAILIGAACLPEIFNISTPEKTAVIGLLIMFVFVAAATGLIIYTKLSVPQEIEPYITQKTEFSSDKKNAKVLGSFFKFYGLLIVIIYLLFSFLTGLWAISWIIFLIGEALKQAIIMFYNARDTKESSDEK